MPLVTMLVQTALLALIWNVLVITSSAVNQTTGQEVSSMLPVTSAEEARRVRRLEMEMETLRRMVTDLKAAGPCTAPQRCAEELEEVISLFLAQHSRVAFLVSCVSTCSSLEADALSVAQEVRGLRHHVQSLTMHSELSAIRSELQSPRSRLPSDITDEVKAPSVSVEVSGNVSLPSASPGSAYIRWGSGQCPPEAVLVYSGVIGGSNFANEGAAANPLCLPLNPVFQDYVLPNYVAHVYGAEYQVHPLPSADLEAKCSVCHVTRTAIIMVPATNACHTGWRLEYSGILMAGFHGHKAATEFICMDSALEGMPGTEDNREGNLFYFAVTLCGSLPCPPYINSKVLSCVVCSK